MAILLLAISLLTLSGVASTAATLLDHQAQSSCCGTGGGETPEEGPCSSSDCPCVSCMNLILPYSITLRESLTEQLLPGVSPKQMHVCEYVPSIEYPPETI